MMDTQLDMTASVIAICLTMSRAPTLLCRKDLRTGRISKKASLTLLSLELPGRLHAAGAPGGVQAGTEG